MTQTKQVEQLKLNVTNIHSFLVKENKRKKKLSVKKEDNKKRKLSFQKQQQKEKQLEAKKAEKSEKDAGEQVIKTSSMGLLDKLFNFGGLLIGGILVNAADGIVKEGKKFYADNKELFDTIGGFLTGVKDAVVGLLDSFTGSESEEGAFDGFAKFGDDGKLLPAPEGGALSEFKKVITDLAPIIEKINDATKNPIVKALEKSGFIPERSLMDRTKEFVTGKGPGQLDSYESDDNIGSQNNNGESYTSGAYIGPPGDRDGQQTGLNMNLPGGIGTPIYAPFDMIYKSMGTDGNPSVGLDGTKDALGPSGRGFGYYGAYRYEKNGKEYEVLMGHFRDLPFRGTEGQVIPKGTLLGYQGASGRSVPGPGNPDPVYPHITLHVNGIGFTAKNSELESFANKLLKASPTTKIESPGEGGGKLKQIKTISQRDPRKRRGSMTIAVQRVNTIQTVPYMMPVPTKSRSSSTSQPQLPSIWSA